jgi:hypothetical protein
MWLPEGGGSTRCKIGRPLRPVCARTNAGAGRCDQGAAAGGAAAPPARPRGGGGGGGRERGRRIGRRLLAGPRRNHEPHGHLQVLRLHPVATAQGRMGPGHPHRIELRTVPFHTTPQGLVHQIGDLLTADGHIREPLSGQE